MLPLFKDLYFKITKDQYKRYSINVISQILAEIIINNLITNAYCIHKIVYPNILKLCPEGYYMPLYVCYKSVIIFGTRKMLLDSLAQIMWTLGTDTQWKQQTIQ